MFELSIILLEVLVEGLIDEHLDLSFESVHLLLDISGQLIVLLLSSLVLFVFESLETMAKLLDIEDNLFEPLGLVEVLIENSLLFALLDLDKFEGHKLIIVLG